MSVKTIFIVLISVLVTVILMNNTDEIDFWIFGEARIPKLAILGSMFFLGLIAGFLLGRPKKKEVILTEEDEEEERLPRSPAKQLSDADRDYIQ